MFMVQVDMVVDIHEPMSFVKLLGLEERIHIGYCDVLITKTNDDGSTETWGIERKTITDAMNSWMSKRLDKQLSELKGKVDHAILLIEHEPERIEKGGNFDTYGRFAHHIANLKLHLNRLAMEVCPVIYGDNALLASKEVLRLKKRIEDDKYGSLTVYNHKIRHVDPHLQFLMAVPRIGGKRAKFIMERFTSLSDLIERSSELSDMFRSNTDAKTIQDFLGKKW
jgi:ERCC4-type nuclease